MTYLHSQRLLNMACSVLQRFGFHPIGQLLEKVGRTLNFPSAIRTLSKGPAKDAYTLHGQMTFSVLNT